MNSLITVGFCLEDMNEWTEYTNEHENDSLPEITQGVHARPFCVTATYYQSIDDYSSDLNLSRFIDDSVEPNGYTPYIRKEI